MKIILKLDNNFWTEPMKHSDELLAVCARHTRAKDDDVVIPEAYLPYVPPNWNRLLVLAEAQNLSELNGVYVRSLGALKAPDRMTRLRDGSDVGVAPWDDGSLKLAIESACEADSTETAVSNAVPWSRREGDGANTNPSQEMIEWAVTFWKDLLPLLRPSHIITAGKVAETVITLADPSSEYCRTSVRLPSPQAMSRVSGMFQIEDLLARYPEVRRVVDKHPEWSLRNKVFFACHVVSTICPTLIRPSVIKGNKSPQPKIL
ncbi:MAG: hypothetical protein ACC630_06460 [Nitrospinota bacterium]